MTLTIRPLRDGDREDVWGMLHPVFRAGETYCIERDIGREGALAFWCDPPHRVFMAIEGEVAVGTLYLMANRRGGGAHVANAGFVTAPSARGRGVAREMLAFALTAAREAGFSAMQFNFVVETNAPALKLWREGGFKVVGRLPDAFDHPRHGLVDAVVLWRTLDPSDQRGIVRR